MTKVNALTQSIKDLLNDLSHLRTPAVAASAVAFVVQFIPGVDIPGTTIAGVLMGIGALAEVVENYIWHQSPVTQSATPVSKDTLIKDVEEFLKKAMATPAVFENAEKIVEEGVTDLDTVVKKATTRKKKVAAATPVVSKPSTLQKIEDAVEKDFSFAETLEEDALLHKTATPVVRKKRTK